MYSIDLSRMIEHLQSSDCMEIINELTPISGIEVYEIDKDNLIELVAQKTLYKNEVVVNNKQFYENTYVKNMAKTLLDLAEGVKYGTIFIKVCNGKIEKCGSFTTLLRNIIGEYYTGQNKEIIAKAFKDRIDFY